MILKQLPSIWKDVPIGYYRAKIEISSTKYRSVFKIPKTSVFVSYMLGFIMWKDGDPNAYVYNQ